MNIGLKAFRAHPLNQEPFGPQEGEREGPDGPLCRNALVSLGSFVAIFRTRLRPPFLFVCLTPCPFALLFMFSFFRLIGPRCNCGLSWRFWSYHVVRRFIYILYHRRRKRGFSASGPICRYHQSPAKF